MRRVPDALAHRQERCTWAATVVSSASTVGARDVDVHADSKPMHRVHMLVRWWCIADSPVSPMLLRSRQMRWYSDAGILMDAA
jgi:hypothetical protein